MEFEVPIAEMKGFNTLLLHLQDNFVREIRQRKGLSAEPFSAEHYLG